MSAGGKGEGVGGREKRKEERKERREGGREGEGREEGKKRERDPTLHWLLLQEAITGICKKSQ